MQYHTVPPRSALAAHHFPNAFVSMAAVGVDISSAAAARLRALHDAIEEELNMDVEKKVKVVAGAPVAPADSDEDTREFEALIRDIAELRDADTVVEHMDIATYRKRRRS